MLQHRFVATSPNAYFWRHAISLPPIKTHPHTIVFKKEKSWKHPRLWPTGTSDVSLLCWTVCCPHFSAVPPSSPSQIYFKADHFSGAVGANPLSRQQSRRLVSFTHSCQCSRPLRPLALAGLRILNLSTMRSLLESSWRKFGPAGRDSLDWSSGPSALPSTDRQAPVSLCRHRFYFYY